MDCVVKKNIGIMAYISDLVTRLSFNFIVGLNFIAFSSKLIIIHSHTPQKKESKN